MASIQPFKIDIPQAKLDRLKQKLLLADFPDEIEDSGWDRGPPLADIKRLTTYWANKFDWRKVEAALNKDLPQFTADIKIDGWDTLKIHFVHQPSPKKNAIPLLFVHGWPGSFVEVSKIMPMLVDGGTDQPSFHIVAPSLVNFGFSQGVSKKGWTSRQHSEVCHALMQLLGYEQYVTQGGDIGTGVTRGCGKLHPEACKASHLNMLIPNPPTMADVDLFFRNNQATLSEAELNGIKRTEWFRKEGYGYNLEHSTKPQTIGYSMADSPVGLLGWIYEKLHDWTDAYPWTDDEVLTFICIYWFSTAGPAASQRLYYESMHDPNRWVASTRDHQATVKLGVARFPREIFLFPKLWAETMGPVVLHSEYDRGGHFAAYERPDAIVADLREMFGKKGGAYGVVRGRSGFD